MNIAVIGPQFPDSFARNVSVTLSRMGHQVTDISGQSGAHNRNRIINGVAHLLDQAVPYIEASRYKKIVREVGESKPDLIVATIASLPPELVDSLKAVSKCPVVCWYTDCGANLKRLYLVACNYDVFFLKEPFLVRTLREDLGLNTIYLPEACNPLWHRKVEISEADVCEYGCDIAAAGGLHYYRARIFEPLVGRNMKIWGNNAPSWLNSPTRRHYMGKYVAEETKAIAYGAAKVFINNTSFLEVEGVNCTLFEAAGCGAFQIARWRPMLAEHFAPEQEIVTYRTRDELIEKVDHYLQHPTERQEIAGRAHLRAHREHTYEHRLTKMMQVLGLTDQRQSVAVAP